MRATLTALVTVVLIAAAAPLAQAQGYYPAPVGPAFVPAYRPVYPAPVYVAPAYQPVVVPGPVYRPAYYGAVGYGSPYLGAPYYRNGYNGYGYPRPVPYGPTSSFSIGVAQPGFGFGLSIR